MNLRRLICFFALLVVLVATAHGQIYSPSNGSAIPTTSQFYWYSDWNNSYYVMFGSNGCYSSNFGASWWNVTTITLGLSPSQTGNIWATIYWYPQYGSSNLTSACYQYNVGGPSGATITSPANGSKITNPSFCCFQTTSSAYPFYVTTGWSGPGSSEIGYNVALYGSFYYPSGLPYSNAHPYTYIRITASGVSHDYQYANADPPALPNNSTLASGSYNLPSGSTYVGQKFVGTFTFTNTGTKTWQADDVNPSQPTRMGIVGDTTIFGPPRYYLPVGAQIAPGQSATFTANFTAPSTPGTYSLSTRMVQDGVEWFGGTSTISIVVNALGALPTPTLTFAPEPMESTIVDDITGTTVTLPTADNPGLMLMRNTSQGDNDYAGAAVLQSDTFTTTITGLVPGSAVYVNVQQRVIDPLGAGATATGTPGDRSWCGSIYSPTQFDPGPPYVAPWPNCNGNSPIGYADSSGYFSISGSYAGMRLADWMDYWGVQVPGQANTVNLSSPYTIAATIIYPSQTTLTTAIRTGNRVSAEAASAHAKVDGGYQYDFVLDTTEAERIRLGDEVGYADRARTLSVEKGWTDFGIGWAADANAVRSKKSKFSLISDWSPGPVSVMFQGNVEIALTGDTLADTKLANQVDIQTNSKRRTIIGPAIPPEATESDLRALIRDWVSRQNIGFLQPINKEDVDLRVALSSLKPTTTLERQIFDCLEAAVKEMK